MGSRFYFFTEPDKLGTQVDAQAFGPAASAPGHDRYRITDTHPLTGPADAVAVCDGILCAQADGPGTLSLILKPSQAPPFESPVVSYFIYKGIDETSLLSGDQILDETDARATAFTRKIAKEWKAQNQGSLTGSRAALGLDRDATFVHDGTNIFTDTDPIERLFTYPHKTVQLPIVAAGDIIGSFKTGAGFEIVLRRLGYEPKLAFARSAENYISVASLSSSSGWQADDAEFFTHWHAKEQILAFMDPCAFFGAFVQAKLHKKSGATGATIKGSDIYPDILKKFFNCNIAYLDIRNNYSYSYNLFGLYDDAIRFVSHDNPNLTNDRHFRAGLWPILRLVIADVPGSRKKSLHRTRLRLPVGLSTAPAVLVSKGFVTTLGPEKPKYRTPVIAADSADPAFYQPIRLAFPVTSDAVPAFSCSYTRVNIYEKTPDSQQTVSPLSIAGGQYLDGLFRLSDLQLDTDFAGNGLRFAIYPEELLVDLRKDFGPTYSAAVGVAEDASHVTLFTVPNYFLPSEHDAGQPRVIASLTDTFGNAPETFQGWLARSFSSTEITKTTINSGTQNEVDLLIVQTQQQEGRAKLTGLGQLKDNCLIILERADHTALVSAIRVASSLTVGLPVFSRITSVTEVADVTSNADPTTTFSYIERTLQATGYQPDASIPKIIKSNVAWNKLVLEYASL